jgi:glucose/arabinose dehydrogenase
VNLSLTFTPVATGIASPTVITNAGDGSGRLFLVEQTGTIRIVRNGVLLPAPFLNISDRLISGGERGLLGLAFPPGFSGKGYFYVNYTRSPDAATVVSRFFVSPADPDAALTTGEEIILTQAQPFANHNGGQLAFGPDGFLYVGLGDGGSGGDPQGNGQNPATLLGKLLRIDVEAGTAPYAIPAGNPFANEIWASGLRNPWRFSFDRLTGDLFLADVGQNIWEEINFQAAGAAGGANYGWNIFEGPDCFSPAVGCVEPSAYSAPVAFYNHDLGCSVTGGHVYRGPGNPGLQGVYLFGDFCSGRLWSLRPTVTSWSMELLTQTNFSISTFGEDEQGALYVADYGLGTIYRIDAS